MLHLGKRDFVPDSRDHLWADILPSTITVPKIPKPHGGFGMDFPTWKMLGNGPQDDDAYPADWAAAQGCGDCTIADPMHATMEEAHNAGRPVPPFSTITAVNTYSTLTALANGTGYDPQSGSGDSGLEIRSVLNYRQNPGIPDDTGERHAIGPYYKLNPGNMQELWEALWFTEKVTLGIQLQQRQMDETNQGQTWTYDPASPGLGGHDIVIVGHPNGDLWTALTWGQRQLLITAVIFGTCDEAWAYFDAEDISLKTGKTYEGYDPELVQEYMTIIAASFPN